VLKVDPPDGYPPEQGRYARGNDYSPVAVCVILDTFDFAIPAELNELVMAGADSGAAIAGLLQTENIGLEKMACNIPAFAIELGQHKCHLEQCPVLHNPQFAADRQALAKLLESE
jgi:tetrahydromethanopterin S-methyltransferase subunit A